MFKDTIINMYRHNIQQYKFNFHACYKNVIIYRINYKLDLNFKEYFESYLLRM